MEDGIDDIVLMAYEIYYRISVMQPYNPHLNFTAYHLWHMLAMGEINEQNGDDVPMEHSVESAWARASRAIAEYLEGMTWNSKRGG